MRRFFTRLGVLTSRPEAFLIVGAYVILWLLYNRQTFEWHAVVTVSTLFMTLFIQRAEHRDTQAIHAKLDELIHAVDAASNRLTKVDEEEPEQIEEQREQMRKDD